MFVYKPKGDGEFAELMERGIPIDRIKETEDHVNFTFKADNGKKVVCKLKNPVAKRDGAELSEVPPLRGCKLRDMTVFGFYESALVPPMFNCSEIAVSMPDGKTMIIEGSRV